MQIDFKGGHVNFLDEGNGIPVVFLHGLLENKSMWQDFIPVLSKTHRIVCIDLLGHGGSSCFGYVHTMQDHAEAVLAVLNFLKIKTFYLIGHSMGGYVALQLAQVKTESILGVCLLNSTFYADTNKRKLLRTRAVKMAKLNYKNLIRMSFLNLFSIQSIEQFKLQINRSLIQALQTPLQGYIACTEGMKLREDLSQFYIDSAFKKLLLLGKKDQLIESDDLELFAKQNDINCKVLMGGHMSHIEDFNTCLKAIIRFLN